jgi:hypothetical protein
VTTLDQYVLHATKFGGLQIVWATALDDLTPMELGELAIELRAIAARRPRFGKHRDPFTLTRKQKVRWVSRFTEAGIGDIEICRYLDITAATLGKVRQNGPTPANRPNRAKPHGGLSVTEVGPKGIVHPGGVTNGRRCEWCGMPLPSTLRTGARFCAGGVCKQQAYRARRATKA